MAAMASMESMPLPSMPASIQDLGKQLSEVSARVRCKVEVGSSSPFAVGVRIMAKTEPEAQGADAGAGIAAESESDGSDPKKAVSDSGSMTAVMAEPVVSPPVDQADKPSDGHLASADSDEIEIKRIKDSAEAFAAKAEESATIAAIRLDKIAQLEASMASKSAQLDVATQK